MTGKSDELLGALHDVSNGLTVILGWVEELKAHPEKLPHALKMIEKRAILAHDLSRRAIGVNVTTVEEFETVDDAIHDTLEGLRVVAEPSQIRIERDLQALGAPLLGASELGQVLSNLVMNAISFSPPGGTVTVRSRVSADTLYVEVEDQGPGVSEDQARTIFEQGGSTRKGGAGVGLSHARLVALSNGGSLQLAQSKPHAVFRLGWPKAGSVRPAPRSIPPASSSAQLLASRRVLLIDDDQDILDLLEMSLETKGLHVSSGKTASHMDSAPGDYDAALLDLSPFRVPLDEVLTKLRARWPKIGVVLISGTVTPPAGWNIYDRVRWVRKPFEVAEVIAALAEVVE